MAYAPSAGIDVPILKRIRPLFTSCGLGSIKIGRTSATDPEVFRPRVDTLRLKSERLMGRMEALPADLQTDAVIGLMLSEAIKTSAIEGESLDRDSVRASLLQLIAQDTVAPRHQDEKALGLAAAETLAPNPRRLISA